MSEYINSSNQTVAYGAPAILLTSVPCTRGFVYHTNNFGIITLTGKVNNPCAGFTRYNVRFDSNIAIPTGGTVGEIDLGLTLNGEPIPTSIGAATPTVVDAYFYVSGGATITVPRTVDYTIAVENLSKTEEAINLSAIRVTVDRIA